MTRPTWADGLLGVSACDEGIAALAEVVGDLDAPMPCSWEWALAVLSSPDLPTYEYVGWAIGYLVDPCDVGVVAGADLRGAYLRWATLCWADLGGADLRYAMLTGAILAGADLTRANLAGATLRDANLAWASLAGATLWSADLSGADLRDANLAGADLAGADLRGANLIMTDLRDANLADARRGELESSIVGWVVVDGRLRVAP